MNNVQLKFYCPNVPSYCCLGRTHHSKSLDSQWPHINPTPYWFPLESKFYPFFFFKFIIIFFYKDDIELVKKAVGSSQIEICMRV